MKHILLYLCCLVSAWLLPGSACAAATSADYVSVSITEVQPGESWQADIALANPASDNYTAFQMDITLPDGFSYKEGSAVAGARISATHDLVAAVHPDGFLRIATYAADNAAIHSSDGSDGPIASFQFTVTDGATAGNHTLRIDNIRFSLRTGAEAALSAATAQFSYKGNAGTTTYHLIYMVDGEVLQDILTPEGTEIAPIDAPEKEGHTFAGWDGLPGTMPAEDVTVTGKYTVNKYEITYTIDGEEFASDSIAFGAEITPPAAPEKEGHTFNGWEGLPETMPAQDVAVGGTFTVNEYTITYYLNGEVYKTETVAYGAVIVPPAVEVSEGEVFTGWADLPETMPAQDLSIHGTAVATGITALPADATVDVYDLRGILVRKGIAVARLKHELPPAIYLINGKVVRIGR